MAITVGDAVFNFIGDTSQLDQAWNKVETDAVTKAPIVQGEINGIGGAYEQAAQAALTFGQDSQVAAEQTTFSMKEARGSVALVGEEIGVNIPRHIQSFIAGMPGVGAALEAAFSGIALIVLVQLIVEATEKLTEFVSETFIYTEAMKEEYAATVELNKALVDHAAKLKELQESYRLLNLEGAAKTKEEFIILTEEVQKNEAALRAAKNTLAQYHEEQKNGPDLGAIHTITKEQADAAGAAILNLTTLLKNQYQQQAAYEKQYDKEALDEQIQHGEASISAQKTISESRIELARAESTLRLTLAKAGYSSLIEAQQAFDEQTYQIQLKALRDTLALLSQDPVQNVDRIKETNAQIEQLENEHQKKLLDIRIKAVQDIQAAVKQAASITQGSDISDILIPPPDKLEGRLLRISDVLTQLGITSRVAWAEQVSVTDDALAKITDAYQQGEASIAEYLQVLEKSLQAKQGQAFNLGDITLAKQYGEQLDSVRKDLIALGIEQDKQSDQQDRWNKTHNTTIQLIDRWALEMQKMRGELTKTQSEFNAIITDTSQAFGNAIAAWILSQESLGRALRESLAQEAATIAARAAMWGLYYTAWGIADLFWNPGRAGADFASAAEFFAVAALAGTFAFAINPGKASSGTSQAPQTTAAPGIQQGPTQQQNVPHLATGGLVLGPTLAVIGDAMNGANSAAASLSGPGQAEAAIPLDDERATNRIAQAIAKHIPPARVTTNVYGDSIRGLIKKINHEVVHNDAQLHSSNSYRLTRKA